ncbi:ParB/RepB/Spo0J family partition protein (plasmid) [Thermus oshimai]|uniref:ParB/RepB/Spo0J family partition protein n=1 Tax=Thermus oshimai TaxID=56957 RepID=UPI0039A5670A
MSQLRELLGHLEAKAEALDRRLKARTALPLSALLPSPHQPRKRLEGLEDLAASIREKGVLQPLLVRPLGDGRYEIVAGERRFRAAEMAGLEEVPVVVLDLTPEEARAVALIENLKREDLNPYEETVALLDLLALRLGTDREGAAKALQNLLQAEKRKGEVSHNVMGQAEVVEEVFRTAARLDWRSFVQNRLPLLRLPEDLKAALEEGAIPYTAALELKKVRDEGVRKALLEEARAGLSLRDLRARVRAVLERRREERRGDLALRLKALLPRLRTLSPERRARAETLLAELEALVRGKK